MKTEPVCIVDDMGNKRWYLHGKLHREDGPAIETFTGSKHWYFDDKLHRLDGPAIEYKDGAREWFINGKLHRLDGPAINDSYGLKWYVNNHDITKKIKRWANTNDINLYDLSENDKLMIKLFWADYDE